MGTMLRAVRTVLLLLGVSVLAAARPSAATGWNARLGGAFPDMAFADLVSPEDYATLGLETGTDAFRLSRIPGRLLVLEFFNQHCFTCRRQAPFLEAFFRRVAEDEDLRGTARVLAVGVGNRGRDLAAFRQELGLGYPMAPDPRFERYLELGDPGGTPFTVFLVRDGARWIVADFHRGLQGDTELLARARVLLAGHTDVARRRSGRGRGDDHHPPLGLTDEERTERARAFLSRVAGTPVTVRPLDLAGGVRVYESLAPGGSSLELYARIASRDPACDVCHAVHFLFAFDRQGRVRGFDPIHVTKFGNELWSSRDEAELESRLRDRRLDSLAFDPEVDAVASATMSSALIFDEVRRTAALLEELERRPDGG